MEKESSSPLSRVHPDLRGGRAPFPHSLNPRQLEAVAAICDTFLPALPIQALECKADEQRDFFATSASDVGVPAEVAGMIFEYLDAIQLPAVLRALSLLSTRIGTLLLCGRFAFSWKFPFLHRFAELPSSNREKTIRSWSIGTITLFHSLFKLFKCFSMFSFFTKTDQRGRNEYVWNAIGYPTPEPDWTGLKNSDVETVTATDRPPLRTCDVQEHSRNELADFLAASGFTLDKSDGEADLGTLDCDVVVVGSGSGGGVCAGILARKGYKVVVLEKGKYYVGDQLSLLEGPSMRAMYEGGGLLCTVDGGMNILAGSTVGGGTTLNWSASFRTPENIRREWSQDHGLELFASKKYEAAMEQVCDRLGVRTRDDEEEYESFQNAVLRDGCRKLGFDVETIPLNCRGEKHQCGNCGLGCKSRIKQGTQETWLMDAVDAGAVILCACYAERISLKPQGDSRSNKHRKAVGVIASSGGRTLLVRAKATIASCGALNTPVLLQRSGLANRYIGSELHLHPTQIVWGYIPPRDDLPRGAIFDGPIMTAFSKLPDAVLEVPALCPGSFAVMSPWRSGLEFKEQMLRYTRTAHIIVIARDRGSGSIASAASSNSSSSSSSPRVEYRLSDEDERTLKAGAERAIRALAAAGAEEIGLQHPDGETLRIDRSSPAEREARMEGFVTRMRSKRLRHAAMAMASAHQMGSCRMGVDAASSAVDPRGEAWEAAGLFVADASVFPTALGVNPMITVQSIAICIAQAVDCFLEEELAP